MEKVQEAAREFANVFGETPTAYGLAPGRVEVIGNHTDYNEGFILSAAIDRHIVVCGRPIPGDTAKIYSRTFNAGESFTVSDLSPTTENFWANYVEGVVDALQKKGIKLGAFEALLMGDVPLGSGLSSSAALEVATACFLQQIYPFEMNRLAMATTCQAAENDFVGVGCGILDQFSSLMGKQDHLVFLDCRDLSQYDHIPLGSDVEFVLANTNASHELADGTYNRLRKSCFKAADYFSKTLDKPVTHLRDVTVDDFTANCSGLDATKMQRARHIITENERVLKSVEALRNGDRKTLGELMLASHASSRDDFGNSCEELDVMVDLAKDLPGCHGCRLSGGGFGGCTVNLVEADKAQSFADALAPLYKEKTGIVPEMHICKSVDGASGGAV